MGFDQYHEPPEELPAETRTFARLCASLTEEAEAIGWYEQRLAVEPDERGEGDHARRPGRGVQALRDGPRVPPAAQPALARRSPQGVLFQDGDIVEHGEAAEAEAARRGRRWRRRRWPAATARSGSAASGGGTMNHLLRELAPLTDSNWKLLDDEARERLSGPLAARRLVDFSGPHGWEHSATNLGRAEPVDAPDGEGVTALQRRVLPLVELRVDFAISRAELRDDDRGAVDVDLEPLDEAAHQIALAENVAVFHGWAKAGIAGVAEASPIDAGAARRRAPRTTRARSPARSRRSARGGVEGPYGLALGPDEYTRVIETAEHGGYPLFDHLAKILGGADRLGARRLSGAVVLSLRGGDFLFESGQDLSIGYSHHDADAVHLYLEESFSFVVATPEAAAPLSP